MFLKVCYFTCQKLSKFYKTCCITTKETALAPFIWPTRYTNDI